RRLAIDHALVRAAGWIAGAASRARADDQISVLAARRAVARARGDAAACAAVVARAGRARSRAPHGVRRVDVARRVAGARRLGRSVQRRRCVPRAPIARCTVQSAEANRETIAYRCGCVSDAAHHHDPTVPEARVGRVLGGKWRIERLLGSGAVASVYSAIDPNGAKFALKVMHPELVKEATVRQRFLREATLAGSIEHEGVVHVHAQGATDDGAPFLVMELLDGETLEQRQERKGGKLPVREVLWIADEILDALAVTHAMGIV